jgi:GrpB-like predicted nucleotidyltransferase (UPF0157 family)
MPMLKDLTELSPEELGQLFPIEIVPYNPLWHDLFLAEKAGIERIISPFTLKIEHFGSTAIPNMASLIHTELWDRIHFIDFLISHSQKAKEYESLKFKLAQRFRNDRDAYTKGRTRFVQNIMTQL